MNVRAATEADLETLFALWDEFCGPELPPWVEGAREAAHDGIVASVRDGLAFVAEDGEPLGFACGTRLSSRLGELTELYVRPQARRRGLATRLVGDVVDALTTPYIRVGVGDDDAAARAFYRRLGFRTEQLLLLGEAGALAGSKPAGRSFGSVHVQTDDLTAVERAVASFVPRLGEPAIGEPRNGWIAVSSEQTDRDPKRLTRLARELADRLGAVVLALGVEDGAVVRFSLFERGRLMDEYLSVQEHYGPLPPGDVIGLAANPTVVARLTGAEPAAVRAAAVHADSPDELPPPEEILARLAAAIGVEARVP
jgi:ribosomal protein S18 acetylase RimI-like enzyme